MSNNVFVPYPIGSVVVAQYFDIFRVAAHVTRKIGGRTCHGLVMENTPGTDAHTDSKVWGKQVRCGRGGTPSRIRVAFS